VTPRFEPQTAPFLGQETALAVAVAVAVAVADDLCMYIALAMLMALLCLEVLFNNNYYNKTTLHSFFKRRHIDPLQSKCGLSPMSRRSSSASNFVSAFEK
jgi:hypothetical protein